MQLTRSQEMNRFWADSDPDRRNGYLTKVPGTTQVVRVSFVLRSNCPRPLIWVWGTEEEAVTLSQQGTFVEISSEEARTISEEK